MDFSFSKGEKNWQQPRSQGSRPYWATCGPWERARKETGKKVAIDSMLMFPAL